MQFSPASIQSIKSISQHALTRYWNRLAGGRSFPSIEEFDPGPRLHDPKQLVKWTIEDAFGQRRFRALYQGTNVAEVFNASWAGRTMDEVVPVPLKSMSIDGRTNARQAVARSTRSSPLLMRMGIGWIASGFCCRSVKHQPFNKSSLRYS